MSETALSETIRDLRGLEAQGVCFEHSAEIAERGGLDCPTCPMCGLNLLKCRNSPGESGLATGLGTTPMRKDFAVCNLTHAHASED